MRKPENKEHIEGRLYQHSLELKTVQNSQSPNFGKQFIAGNIDIAIDEEGLNVIPVHFTYVTEETSKGDKNRTFGVLKQIIDGAATWLANGKDTALKVKVDTALALNDFYLQDGTLVSSKQNEGGFVSIVNGELCPVDERNTWEADMVITGTTYVEADEERNIKEDFVTVKGAIFNFRNALLPVDFVVRNKDGMSYFEGLEASAADPKYARVWGKIFNKTIKIEVQEESAFGEPVTKTTTRKEREWLITGTKKALHDFGDENVLTADELTKAIQDRNVMLAELKKRSDEYRASKETAPAATTAKAAPTAAPKGGFTF